jgi:Flp pilus assembly protein TadG
MTLSALDFIYSGYDPSKVLRLGGLALLRLPIQMPFDKRSTAGQSTVALMLVLAMCAVLPIGLFSYELARYSLAKQQLKACLQSAALAAGTANASSNSLVTTTTQQTAMALALNILQQQSILGASCAGATSQGLVTSTPTMSPGANQTIIAFEFIDPQTNQPVGLGSANGKIIKVMGCFGFVPLFTSFTRIGGVVPIYESSNGGLPMLDVILCFDISSSMDDFTNISIVYRYNNTRVTPNVNGYTVINQGPLYPTFGCQGITGTSLDATVPQSLDDANWPDGNYIWGDPTCANIQGERGKNNGFPAPIDQAKVPSNTFTDLVVNIDGTTNESAGITVNGCYFPAGNIGILVEASRGNLESKNIADKAHVPYGAWGITPEAGYYAAYNQAALAQRHPIQDAIGAAQNFFTIMNNDCDAHFGLVTFSSLPGTSATSTVPSDNGGTNPPNPGYYADGNYNYHSNFPADPYNPMPPNPGIPLNPAAGSPNSNYSTVMSAVTPLLAFGETNIAGALQNAVNQMTPTSQGGQGLTRIGAKKAIVLFTDGLPTVSTYTPTSGDPQQDTILAAQAANAQAIPIYCVGLCLTPGLQALQTQDLTDQPPAAGSPAGIAYTSGNGATFYQATQVNELNAIFENIARSLVQLVN